VTAWRTWGSLAFSVAALIAGIVLWIGGAGAAAEFVWAGGVAVVAVPLTIAVVRNLARGDVGVDLIALAAMAGTLAIGEYLAGVVVAIMLSGGNALEAAAGRRARRELTTLLQRAPRTALIRGPSGLVKASVDDVAVGDVLVVRSGELVPVDGILIDARAVVDESALTGESLPTTLRSGDPLRSGAVNAGDVFSCTASRRASESAYAQIVSLVRSAESQRAPFVRMADRFAVLMLPVTAAIAGAAWALSGDPVRAVAVLVVATPCPLILAAPIALISGVARAARIGVIVKGGGVIEQLGRAKTVLFDKTGTLTRGAVEIEKIIPLGRLGPDALLSLAASIEQYSLHVTAAAIVQAAHQRGVPILDAADVVETAGAGVEGRVDGRRVAVGGRGVGGGDSDGHERAGRAVAGIWIDHELAGEVVLADPIRADATSTIERLRSRGIRRIAMVSGDRHDIAETIGARLGMDAVYAEQSPAGKVEVLKGIRAGGGLDPVVMVGDGVNDAPALALADCGIAMAAGGASVSSEAADAVITVDRVDRVADAVEIGRASLRIALQSMIAGLGLSGIAMLVAALGYLPPIAGALVQEAIDVAVILNALRALGRGR
jgi:heavy metal translocating P-type ATPase